MSLPPFPPQGASLSDVDVRSFFEALRAELSNIIPNKSADASPDTAADYILVYDTSAGVYKKVILENLGLSGSGASDESKQRSWMGI